MKEELLKRRHKDFLILPLALFFAILACAPREAPALQTKIQEKQESPAIKARASWEQEWDDLVKAAQKEGKLVLYSGLEPYTLAALVDSFGKKYGIDLENISGQSRQLETKITFERAAGLYIPDMYIEGPSGSLRWKQQGLLQNLKPLVFRPDVLDKTKWKYFYGPFWDKDGFQAGGTANIQQQFTLNTKVAGPAKQFTSMNDVLDPTWKGKIVSIDPSKVGGALTAFAATYEIMGDDYMKKFGEQIGAVVDDKRLGSDWLVRGKYPIGFGLSVGVLISDYMDAGVDWIDHIQPKEGFYMTSSGAAVIFDRAPHPNAAKLFLNWFLTKEGQETYVVPPARNSRRVDVSKGHLKYFQKEVPGLPVYALTAGEEFSLKKDTYLPLVEKYFGKHLR